MYIQFFTFEFDKKRNPNLLHPELFFETFCSQNFSTPDLLLFRTFSLPDLSRPDLSSPDLLRSDLSRPDVL